MKIPPRPFRGDVPFDPCMRAAVVAVCAAAPRGTRVFATDEFVGEVFARNLASKGYRLLLVARREERLSALAALLGPNHEVMAADLTKEEDLERLARRLEASADLARRDAPHPPTLSRTRATGSYLLLSPVSSGLGALVLQGQDGVDAPVHRRRDAVLRAETHDDARQ